MDSQAPKSAALNITHFFTSKTGKSSRYCVSCKEVSLLINPLFCNDPCHFRAAFDALGAPAKWPPSRTYTYSTSTLNTGLRGHLDKFHKEEYIKLAKERGWTTVLPSVKRELALVAPAKKPMFSIEGVTQRLVRFIAANDQVSFNCVSPTAAHNN